MAENEDFAIDLSIPGDDDPGFQLRKTCANLFNKSHFVDVTLSCPDGQVQAHRMVLSSASTYLYNLFVSTPWPTPCSHPVIILRKSTQADVRSSLEFIYSGKTRTSKNKLLSLMEVGRELGFTMLLKSIETAIQSCGIEMFRRLSANSVKDISRNTSSSSSDLISKQHNFANINIGKEITIKEEPYEFDAVQDISQKMSDSVAKVKRHISPNSSCAQKLIRLNNVDKNYIHSLHNSDSTWMDKKVEYGKSNGHKDDDSYNDSNPTPIQLQHDKGESFVYTSEDLGMVGMNDEDDEDDPNESGDEQLLLPQQTMMVPNGISVLSIPSIGKLNGSGNSSNSIIQVDVKQEEQDDGVPASCPWCLQVFTSLTLLQRHIKSHVGNYKPFTCEYCQNTFARSAHLKRHLRTHTGEKPYQCSICQRPFARQDKLKVHLERHLHNPVKNGNNSMTITSYPPPSMSQSSGGQVPIKILIPAGQGMGGRRPASTVLSPNGNETVNKTSSSHSPLSLQRGGSSITVTSTTLHSSTFSEKTGSTNGSPSPPTITPINNVLLNQKRIGKSMIFNNFL